MREHEQAGVVEPWLVAGAALYWASIVLQFLFPGTASGSAGAAGGADGLLDSPLVKYLVLAAYVGCGFAFPRVFSTERGRRLLVCGMLAATGAIVALGAPAVPDLPALGVLRTLLHLFTVAVLMVLWGFAFASMDKRRAGQNVAPTMLAAVLLVLAGLALVPAVPVGYVSRALMLASAVPLLSGRVRFRTQRRTVPRDPQALRARRRGMAGFLLSRAAFGLMLGFGIGAPLVLDPVDASPALLVLALAVACAALFAYARNAVRLYFALPTLIMLTAGVVYLPFFEGGLATAAEASVAVAWLVWAEFSAFQLSDLKERCCMGELALCLAEKSGLSLAMAGGVGLFWLVDALAGGLGAGACELVEVGWACFLALGAVWATGRLVGERTEDRLRDELARTRAERTAGVLDAIAAEHGLSAREREVLAMLADGYTRTYIREALGISDGTAKAHIAHVYQKLDVHRKDDLLDLIEARMGGGA